MVRMRRVVISAVSDEFALRLAAGSWDLAISDTKLPLLGSLPLRKYALKQRKLGSDLLCLKRHVFRSDMTFQSRASQDCLVGYRCYY